MIYISTDLFTLTPCLAICSLFNKIFRTTLFFDICTVKIIQTFFVKSQTREDFVDLDIFDTSINIRAFLT